MKTTIVTIIITIVAFSIVGCGDKATRADSATVGMDVTDSVADKCDSISFAFTGDILTGTTFPETYGNTRVPKDEGRLLFSACAAVLKRVDVACGNLEGVICEGGTPKHCNDLSKCFTFRMPMFTPNCLLDAGFDYMNVANNHADDFGPDGVSSSIRELKAKGIAAAGIRGHAPWAILERHGMKIGITGFSTGVSTLSVNDLEELKVVMDSLRTRADLIVVCMHAGCEGAGATHVPKAKEVFYGWPRGDVYKFAHTAIDMGADIVWGHGPHVPRGAELYKDRLVLYSLGNFCTPFSMGISGINGQAPLAEVVINSDGSFRSGRIHSFMQQKGDGPRVDESHAAARTIARLSAEDFPNSPLKISDDGTLLR